MEVGGQSAAGTDHNGAATQVRGRGRARVRIRPRHETENTVRPGSPDSHYNSARSKPDSRTCHAYGRFEDAIDSASLPLVSVSDDKKLVQKINLVTNRSYQSADGKDQLSDKENSSTISNFSPKPQRSRRSHFDVGVMSRINKHLRQGMSERSDGGTTHSLDRKKESPASSRLSRLGSPKLHLEIPARRTCDALNAAAPSRKMADGGRPRSMTHPLPSPSGGESLLEGAKLSDPGCTTVDASSQGHQTSGPQISVSNSSASSLARIKGRGRARGRARRKQQEMELGTRPGSAPGDSHDLEQAESQVEGLDPDRFTDAHTSLRESDEFVDESAPKSEQAQLSLGWTEHAAPPLVEESRGTDSKIASANENGRQMNKSNETARMLTLTIDVDERTTTPGSAEGPEVCSPGLVDDITQLLSPDHEYTLDWAAAMETPTPDTSSDSAPVWNTSDLADNS